MKTRSAFTMIELVFVIVVMGIIGKFGVEFLAQAYKSFIYSNVNNALLSKSASAVEFIGSRLQYRIKDSVIARNGTGGAVVGLGSASGTSFSVLEWVSMDIDGYRATTAPNWSGIADLDPGQALGLIESPATNTGAISALIAQLSDDSTKSVNDAALYFIGSNSDVQTGYGWNGALGDQTGAMHPINATGTPTQFTPAVGTLTGIDVYEYYKLAWTAYAIEHNGDDLILHYDYQPWNGDSIANGDSKTAIIMEDVNTFQFTAIGEIIKIQVCTQSDIIDGDNDGTGYSLCKEKTIF
ncbi:MAG: type II secretion system protein [Campylobacterota bacterium]|nr:type II secretion system protein [Campylobacterota bacterium]